MNDDDGEYDYDDGDKVEPITMNAIAYLVMFKEPKENPILSDSIREDLYETTTIQY